MEAPTTLVPVRVRAAWYGHLALIVLGLGLGAPAWAIATLAVGCMAIPAVLAVVHGSAGVRALRLASARPRLPESSR